MRKIDIPDVEPDFATKSERALYHYIKVLTAAYNESVDQIQWCKDKIKYLESKK